jgi:hypothetical protein
VINISVAPDKYPIIVLRFVVQELSNIDVSVDVLKSIPVLAVVLEMTFIES